MKAARRETLLPVSLGLADGILNALTLASSSLFGGSARMTVGLALRISVASLVTAGFAVFVATYAAARQGLRHASHQLSLPSDAGLVATQLGRNAIRQAGKHSALASGASMLGALVPLLIAATLPGPGWIAAVIAVAAMGILGVGLATAVLGNRLQWAAVLMIGGVTVTAIGAWIKIT